MPDADLPAVLAGIRERSAAALEFPASGFAENSIRCCTQSAMDVPLLLAAIEAVLKAADKWAAESARLDRLAETERDPQARIAISLRAQAFEDCAKQVRAAITAELAKETARD